MLLLQYNIRYKYNIHVFKPPGGSITFTVPGFAHICWKELSFFEGRIASIESGCLEKLWTLYPWKFSGTG